MLFKKMLRVVLFCAVLSSSGLMAAVSSSAQVSQQSGGAVSSQQLALASRNGIYFGGSVAYMWADWSATQNVASGDNNKSSLAYSGYIGYQYTKNFAGELGFFYLPAVADATMMPGGSKGNIKSYVFDVALKMIQPIYSNLNVYAKGGLLYRNLTLDGSASMYGPIFGFGVEYILNPNLSFDFGYNYLKGDGSFNSASIVTVPASNMLMFSINYNFSR